MDTFRAAATVLSAVFVWTLALTAQKPETIRMNVELVQIPVTVTNANNRYISGLQAEHFRIWEDKVEQKILYFSLEDAPMSLVIVLDVSESMTINRARADRTASECLRAGVKADQYSLVLFSSRPQEPTAFTTDITRLQDNLLFVASKGNTALYDAIHSGIITAETGTNPRKALVVITDGFENNSRHSAGDLRRLVREKNIQIYSVGNTGDGALRELTQITGGRSITSLPGLANICSAIARELKNQYLINYKSTNVARDGTWRKVRVDLTLPDELQLRVRSKNGYAAANDN